ncbi:MAG TPA: protein translocase subunit SecD [Candidatus Moranbacteria bacterium]|nr:protein translocase subunit SecD [Candidatus Moranbacteria bacterium]HAT75234.1 protein translocase subunit SecD [Candidatus Moranbacteria bacterium]
MNAKQKLRLKFVLVIILAVVAGFIAYPKAAAKIPKLYNLLNKPKINLGLDLQGGIHLEYKADTSQVDGVKVADAMQAVQDVIERRVNAFGVAEPVVYTTKSGSEQRLVVELAGVKDINEAKNMISETPFLEFRVEKQIEPEQIPQEMSDEINQPEPQMNFISTGLSGKNLKNASVQFSDQGLSEPEVSLKFDDEGTKLFAEITKNNIGKRVAIYLDGEIITAPTVQTEILNGEAVVTGNYTVEEAKNLVKRLNEGALPVPITLISQQSVEASLGQVSLEKSLKAGLIGLALVIIFMLLYYRFLGLIAAFTLLIYSALMISIFKLSGYTPFSITLTLPGIAGFVLSIGMAVDANILIFERTKEEVRRGRNILSAIEEGFKRAWTSIRDGNMSSIITALILVEMGTGFVKGFAVTLIIGVIISMFTAVVITRTILRFVLGEWIESRLWLVGARKEKV